MNTIIRVGVLFLIAAAVTGAAAGAAATAAIVPPPKKILFFTKSSGFEHSVIRERAGRLSFAAQVLQELGPKHGIEFTFSKDGSKFSPDYLAQFDAFFFYTSGDLLSAGKDGHPPMSPAGKQALLDAVKGGKGFIGTHSAADTFHTDETAETNTAQPRTWRYQNRGEKADPYTRMIGGELLVHGTQQIATMTVIDQKFPGLAKRGASFSQQEEWYSMTNFAPDMHVLLRHETSGMRDPNADGKNWPPVGWDTPYQRPPYPNTWARKHGEGRVYFTAMGHREDTWLDPLFQEMLFGGIDWVLRRVEADVTPNLATAAPGANQLPPPSGPVGGLPNAQKQAEDKKYYSK